MHTRGTWLVALLSALILAGCSTSRKSGPPAEVRMDNLLVRPLDDRFTPGRDIIVTYVEIPPNVALERHWHPGEEFHYYLDGEVTIEIDGQEPINGSPGKVGHVPFERMHTAIAGPRGARALVFRVHTKDKPVRYLESESAGDR